MKPNQPYKDNRSKFQVFVDRMYQRYISEKEYYKEENILSQYEYNKQYNDWLRVKYEIQE